MMFSATDFLPDSISTLTNLATSTLPNFGSGRISRFGTSRRRGISIPFCLQLSPLHVALANGHRTTHLLDPIRGRLDSAWPRTTRRTLNYFFAALARLAPYLERACLRSLTPWVSSAPRTM